MISPTKNILSFLIISAIISIVFVLFAFQKTLPLFASNHLVLTQSGKLSIFTFQVNPACDGNLSLEQPYEKLILTTLVPSVEKWTEVGNFAGGDEIIFKLELDGSSSSCTGTFLSTSDDFGYLLSPKENLWFFIESPYLLIAVLLEPVTTSPQHPVIFIHGLGGYPSDWTTGGKRIYFDTLKAEPYNYPEEFLHVYKYADSDGNPATYDNQGDVSLISQGLENEVNRLAALYQPGCAKDCVDIIGFSLGGIIARDYLNNHPTNHKVRKLITIGSPHKGVWLLGGARLVELLPGVGSIIRNVLGKILGELAVLVGYEIDPNSMAIKQVTPWSAFLTLLNSIRLDKPEYSAIYGDIDTVFAQKIFFFELRKEFSIGDGLVLVDSATGIPVEGVQTYGFSDTPLLDIEVKTKKLTLGGYEYVLDVPGFADLKYKHGSLIVQPEVVSQVIEVLTAD